MATLTIPVKTTEGVAELSQRRRRLSQRHRTLLLLIDGRRAEHQVRRMAAQAGVPEGVFEELRALGLIALQQVVVAPVHIPSTEPVDLSLEDFAGTVSGEGGVDTTEFPMPTAQSLQPDIDVTDWGHSLGAHSSPQSFDELDSGDAAVDEARLVMIRAVRAVAPVAGSLTLRRLRRANTREDLAGLISEVEQRITKPARALAAQHTMRRVRQLLDMPYVSVLPVLGT